MQKHINTTLFALMVASLLIAIHQSMQYGFAQSYGFYMLTFTLMMVYQLRANKLKQKMVDTDKTQSNTQNIKNKKNKNKFPNTTK